MCTVLAAPVAPAGQASGSRSSPQNSATMSRNSPATSDSTTISTARVPDARQLIPRCTPPLRPARARGVGGQASDALRYGADLQATPLGQEQTALSQVTKARNVYCKVGAV